MARYSLAWCGGRTDVRAAVLAVTMWLVAGGLTVPVAAQDQQGQGPITVAEVLSFLLTNQAVQTGDFEKDAEATATTRDTITRLLLVELTSLPLGSSSAGFTYRVNPTLGTVERTSASFGPFFAERALTAGRGQFSLGANVQFARYTRLNDIDLESGAFLTTANQFRDEPDPFDVERLKLEIASQTFTILGNIGVTDRLDVGVAVPIVWLSLEGSRVNTYRGEQLLQASGFADANGFGDMALRAKLRLVGDQGAALAVLERPGFRPAVKKTCWDPERPRSRHCSSDRLNRAAWGSCQCRLFGWRSLR